MYVVVDIAIVVTITVFLLLFLCKLYQRNFIICDTLLIDGNTDICWNIARVEKQFCDNNLYTSSGYATDTNMSVRLHYYIILSPNASNTLLFVHGNHGSIDRHLSKAFTFALELVCNVVLFDYAGFGNSTGRCSDSFHLLSNTTTIYSSVIRTDPCLQNTNLYVYGISLGCLPATMLAFQTNVQCTGLIIENAFLNLSYLLSHSRYGVTKFFPSSWINDNYDITTAPFHNKPNLPVMIMCSLHDVVIPFRNSLKIFDSFHKEGLTAVSLVRNDDIDIGHTNAWKFGSVYFNSFKQFMSVS